MPAILTGAAGIALFATIYAAHALYGFIGPAAAFVLLTAAGLVTLFLSVIHGPGLAALGALGSYAAPLLVSSAEPAPFPVVFHTLAVTAAVLGMARIRSWQWLADRRPRRQPRLGPAARRDRSRRRPRRRSCCSSPG